MEFKLAPSYLENGMMIQECNRHPTLRSPLAMVVKPLFKTTHDIVDGVAFNFGDAKGGCISPSIEHFPIGARKRRDGSA